MLCLSACWTQRDECDLGGTIYQLVGVLWKGRSGRRKRDCDDVLGYTFRKGCDAGVAGVRGVVMDSVVVVVHSGVVPRLVSACDGSLFANQIVLYPLLIALYSVVVGCSRCLGRVLLCARCFILIRVCMHIMHSRLLQSWETHVHPRMHCTCSHAL